jgi:adenosylcobinamide kinase/adenosylcobinamide-phosphate guanylyltransferase
MSNLHFNSIHLILGGARSGKSRLAEGIAKAAELKKSKVCYLATAQAHDKEMSERISQHQADRPAHWHLIESPLYLANALEQALQKYDCVLVDCLTLWLSNCLCQQDAKFYVEQKSTLSKFLHAFINRQSTGRSKKVIFVSNEVGHGIVPMGELSRQFVDQAGWLHQELAELASNVDFVMAGLPLNLKGGPIKNNNNTVQENTSS